MSKKYPHVYLDVAMGTKPLGRVVFELFTDVTPKTAENFRGLCTGEYGNIGLKTNTRKLTYQNSKFHRVIDDFMIQGGDITNGDGTGGFSIYGPRFNDENFNRRHACAGLLSMANSGRNTNGSQFFITLKACPHLDGKHVVFGQLIEGMHIIRRIAKVPVDRQSKPKLPISITDCGEVGDQREFLRRDPFRKEELELMRKINRKNVLAFEENPDGVEGKDGNKEEQDEIELSKHSRMIKRLKTEVDEEMENEEQMLGKRALPASKLDKLRELKMKMNKVRKQNLQAVIEEDRRNNNSGYLRHLKLKQRDEYKKKKDDELKFKGVKNQAFMDRPALKMRENKKKKEGVFGWDVFNSDSLYRAYDKRCKNLPFYNELYKKQLERGNDDAAEMSKQRLQMMKDDLVGQMEKRKNFSRRRMFDPEEEVTYINERNRVFNQKLNRHFGEYSKEIKANLERGTAFHN